jgi:subtilase family serine protease
MRSSTLKPSRRPSALRLIVLILLGMSGVLIAGLHAGAASAEYQYSLTPQNIRAAYSLPKTGARHQTIAIISVFDDPAAQSDLNAYTRRFKLPACTTRNGCFRKLNEKGATSPLPGPDLSGGSFVTESSTGIEVARGVCPSCHILLVEANLPSKSDLSAAVNIAAKKGATVIVTTFDQAEDPSDTQYAADYRHPHSIVVAASGDEGYSGSAYFPATLPSVLSVGGTSLSLKRSGTAYRSEGAWPESTSGCSIVQTAPAWQKPFAKLVGCRNRRAVVDLAAAAEPGPLVKIADAPAPCGKTWCEIDGTSVAAPIIGGIIGLAGSQGDREPAMLYRHARARPSDFHDVKSGFTSYSCHRARICQAKNGFDGPTGLGTPNGLAAFLPSGK